MGQKFLEFSSLLLTVTSSNRFYPHPPPPHLEQKWFKTGFYVNIVYGNLQSENSQDYAQKQRNFTFMNLASGFRTEFQKFKTNQTEDITYTLQYILCS